MECRVGGQARIDHQPVPHARRFAAVEHGRGDRTGTLLALTVRHRVPTAPDEGQTLPEQVGVREESASMGALVLYAYFFGPIAPVHEWVR